MPTELISKSESRNAKQIQNSNHQDTKRLLPRDGRFCFESRRAGIGHSILFRISDPRFHGDKFTPAKAGVLRILTQGQDSSILHCAIVFMIIPNHQPPSNVLYIFMVFCSSESNAEYSRRTGHEKTFPFSLNV